MGSYINISPPELMMLSFGQKSHAQSNPIASVSISGCDGDELPKAARWKSTTTHLPGTQLYLAQLKGSKFGWVLACIFAPEVATLVDVGTTNVPKSILLAGQK
jgi:hypothetical protein